MKKVLVMAVTGFALLLSANSFAVDVGVVDMEKIVMDSPQAKKIKADMEKKFGAQRNEVLALGASFRKDMQDYQKNKAVMSKKDLNALQKKMSDEQTKLRDLQGKVQTEISEEQNKKMDEFMADVKAAAKKVADKEDMDLILPLSGVIYSEEGSDVTQKVMDAM